MNPTAIPASAVTVGDVIVKSRVLAGVTVETRLEVTATEGLVDVHGIPFYGFVGNSSGNVTKPATGQRVLEPADSTVTVLR